MQQRVVEKVEPTPSETKCKTDKQQKVNSDFCHLLGVNYYVNFSVHTILKMGSQLIIELFRPHKS